MKKYLNQLPENITKPMTESNTYIAFLKLILANYGCSGSYAEILFEILKSFPNARKKNEDFIIQKAEREMLITKTNFSESKIKAAISDFSKHNVLIHKGGERSAVYSVNPDFIVSGYDYKTNKTSIECEITYSKAGIKYKTKISKTNILTDEEKKQIEILKTQLAFLNKQKEIVEKQIADLESKLNSK